MTSNRNLILILLYGSMLLLLGCSDSTSPSNNTSAKNSSTADKAQKQQLLARCNTEKLAEFNTHMAAKRHSDAASAMRLCARDFPNEKFKQFYEEAEISAYIDDIKNPKTSTFDKVRTIELLIEYYPEAGKAYEVLGAELRMKLHDERQKSAEASKRNFPPSIGISADDARASAWGNPSRINKTTTAYGTTEQWVYETGKYLYIENGRVTAIQE